MTKFLGLIFLTMLFASCVPEAKKETHCSPSQVYNENQRRCISAALTPAPSSIPQVPVNAPSSVTYSTTPTEDTSFTATLAYNDANYDKAISCVISGVSNLSAGACSCTNGTCTASFSGSANYNGSVSFTYYVIDKDGASLATTVNTTLAAANDSPTGSSFTATFNEDILSAVVLPYSDVDGDMATSCSATNASVPFSSYVSFPVSCSCVVGTCTAYLLSDSNYNGTTYFQYTVTANGQTSSASTVVASITAINDGPTITGFTQNTIYEDSSGAAIFTFSDVDSATNSFTCSSFNQSNLTTGSCSCSSTCTSATAAAPCTGSCTISSIAPTANLNSNNSSFAFDYNVLDSALTASNSSSATITISAVDDQPVGNTNYSNISPAAPTEDESTVQTGFSGSPTGVAITLSYTDIDSDLATACSISSLGNGTASACTCTGATYPNTCSFVFTPSAHVNGTGIASFYYSITSATSTSTPVGISFNLTAVNDYPTITSISNVTDNESSVIDITNITVDEGGGIDEDSQTLTVTATSSNQTLIPNGNIVINYIDPGNASASPLSLKITPNQGINGSSTITLFISDGLLSVSTTFTVTINGVSYLHNGWANVKAYGTTTNAEGIILENPAVTLEWESFTPTGTASLAGYKIYRATSSNGQDFLNPLPCNSTYNTCLNSTTVDSSVKKFVDTLPSNIANGTTYYYVVRPLDSNGVITATTETYSEIDVPVPPSNMGLVHKWIANKEMCEKLGKSITAATIDPLNNFRCTYTGPGTNNGYYEMDYHLFVDRFEAGCNYSKAPKCTVNGCIGTASPTTTGCNGTTCTTSVANGDVFYDRSSATCYYYNGGWTQMDSTFMTLFATNTDPSRKRLPPLVKIKQDDALTYCEAQGKRLLSRKEQIAATSWHPDKTSTDITNHESGLQLATANSCNTMSGSGLTYSSGQLPTSGNEDSLPATLNSNLRMVRTGSTATNVCSSRYGIQDLIGNIREWNMDLFYDCNVGIDALIPANNSVKATGTFCSGNMKAHAKYPGLRGNYIRLSFSPVTPGTESVTVSELDGATDMSVIQVNYSNSGTNTLGNIANLINANSDAKELVDLSYVSGTSSTNCTSPAGIGYVDLSGGVTGTAHSTATYATQTINFSSGAIAYIVAQQPGVYGNNIQIEIIDSTTTPNAIDVIGFNKIRFYVDVTSVTLAQMDNTFNTLASGHDIAQSLVTFTPIAAGLSNAQSATNLTGGGKSGCTSFATTSGTETFSDFSSYGYHFDGALSQANGPGSTNSNITSWLLGNTDGNSYSASYIHLPVGMPATNSFDGAELIGGANVTTALLSGDQIDLNIDPNALIKATDITSTTYGSIRYLATGGAWYGAYDRTTAAQGNTGDKAGRYSVDFLNENLQDNYTGFRCAKRAP